jgi:hypothetical protein
MLDCRSCASQQGLVGTYIVYSLKRLGARPEAIATELEKADFVSGTIK